MERKKASDFPQELLNLFDGYVHGGISRRQFIDGAQKFAVARMVQRMLNLAELPAPDAADALALALTHAQENSRYGLNLRKKI